MRPRILLIDGAQREHWYAPLRSLIDARWYVGASPRLLGNARAQIDLAVVNDERALPYAAAAVRRLARDGVPTLHLLDGILEWRNTWENPRYTLGDRPAVPFMQPSLCHKIACLGRSQARILESWGNLGKCEIVGAPRLDGLFERRARPHRASDTRDISDTRDTVRILIMTARVPAFTPSQRAAVKESLLDLKAWFAAHPTLGSTRLRPIWRLTERLAGETDVENTLDDTFGSELASTLQHVDALITTPSTAMLEGMLQGVPVTLLDYNNTPHYVPTAWSITAPQHIDQVLPEFVDPPGTKMLYQDTILHDSLECRTSAGPRLVKLIEEMIRLGDQCRLLDRPLRFPRRILPDEQDGHHLPEARFDFRVLYPDHPVFGDMDRTELQVELGHLQRQIARQGVLEAHPLWGPALRLRRRLLGLLRKLQSDKRAA